MPSVFSQIIAGDLPARFVWKDAQCVAFLSINPLRPGHVLVVPRVEVEDWIDLDDGARDHVFKVAQTIGRALRQAYATPKVAAVLAGLEVPHVHVHLIPLREMRDLDFANADPDPDPEGLDRAAALIRSTLVELGAEPVSLD